jgi:hypothetical protein
MDYTILVMVLVCLTTAVALGIELYKAAEDGPPPFRPSPRTLVVQLDDGRAWRLPSEANARVTRFEVLLETRS